MSKEETQRADGVKFEVVKGGQRFYVIGTPVGGGLYNFTSYAYGRKIDEANSESVMKGMDLLVGALEAPVDPKPVAA